MVLCKLDGANSFRTSTLKMELVIVNLLMRTMASDVLSGIKRKKSTDKSGQSVM